MPILSLVRVARGTVQRPEARVRGEMGMRWRLASLEGVVMDREPLHGSLYICGEVALQMASDLGDDSAAGNGL